MPEIDLKKDYSDRKAFVEALELACNPSIAVALADIKFLHDKYPENFIWAMQHSKRLQIYRKFLQHLKTHDFSETALMEAQFSAGLGLLDYNAGLLACAAIAQLQLDEESFNPVVIKCDKKFAELMSFFRIINDNVEALEGESIKFLVTGAHWFSGKVDIKDGKVKIFIIDALGKEEFEFGSYFPLKNIPDEIKKQFNVAVEIDIAAVKRQNSFDSCMMFAIDDLRKLYKFVDITSDLNLTMLRSMESVSYVREAEQDAATYQVLSTQKVNRRGDSFLQSFNKHLGTVQIENPDTGKIVTKVVNKRAEHKLAMLHKKVVHLLHTHTLEEVKEKMQQFTLDSFAARFAPPLSPRSSTSSI